MDAASLGAFRILFGALMLWEVFEAFDSGHVRELIEARVLFPFELVPFVRPWPGFWMYVHYALMLVGAAGILLDYLVPHLGGVVPGDLQLRLPARQGEYNNHYYLIVLLSFAVAASCPASAGRHSTSCDAGARNRPFWNYFSCDADRPRVLLRWSGQARRDWLAGEPMRTWLADRRHARDRPAPRHEGAVYLFTYGGLFFDLPVGCLLLSRRTLLLALVGLLVFNLTNHWLFTSASSRSSSWRRQCSSRNRTSRAVCFVEPGNHGSRPPVPSSPPRGGRRLSHRLPSGSTPAPAPPFPIQGSGVEEGHRFSWHMKLRSKHGWVSFTVTDPRTGETREVNPKQDLTRRQRRRTGRLPGHDSAVRHRLAEQLEREGVDQPIVLADTWVSLNRRPPQPIVDPAANLAQAHSRVWSASPWIVPLDDRGQPGTLSLAEFGGLGLLRPQR